MARGPRKRHFLTNDTPGWKTFTDQLNKGYPGAAYSAQRAKIGKDVAETWLDLDEHQQTILTSLASQRQRSDEDKTSVADFQKAAEALKADNTTTKTAPDDWDDLVRAVCTGYSGSDENPRKRRRAICDLLWPQWPKLTDDQKQNMRDYLLLQQHLPGLEASLPEVSAALGKVLQGGTPAAEVSFFDSMSPNDHGLTPAGSAERMYGAAQGYHTRPYTGSTASHPQSQMRSLARISNRCALHHGTTKERWEAGERW